MNGVIFLMIAIAFVLVAFLSVVATLSAPPTVRRMTNVADLWLLCRRPGLSNVGRLVRLLAAGIELHARPRAALCQVHLHISVGFDSVAPRQPRQRYPRVCEFWISLKVESTSQNLRRMRLIDDRTFVRYP